MCAHNPRRVCPGALATKGLAGDALRAACGAGARVELVRVGGGGDGGGGAGGGDGTRHPRSRDILVEVTVLDGKAYQALLDAGRGGDEAAALGCALLANNQGGPLLLVSGTRSSSASASAAASSSSSSSPAVSAAVAASLASPDGRVILGLAPPRQAAAAAAAAAWGNGNDGTGSQNSLPSFASLADVSITGSSESLLSGQRPPFRLLARALDATTKAPVRGVTFAVSDAFVVATPRVRTAVKAEIPMASDHVSKLNAVGPQTQAKLADIAAAWRAASVAAAASAGGSAGGGAAASGGGGSGNSGGVPGGSSASLLADPELPRGVFPHASVTTVGQFRDLAEAAASDPELTDALKRVLKLTKGWEAACEHASQAVEVDGRCRVWYDFDETRQRAAREGLIFPGILGAVDLSSPIGLLRPLDVRAGGGGGSHLTAIPRLGPDDAARAAAMTAAAARAWGFPGHPGWTLWEGSVSQDVASRVARGEVIIGGGGSSSVAVVAPPPPALPSLPSRLPTMSWTILAGSGAHHFAPAAAPPPPPPPPPGKIAPIPESPFGAAAAAAVPAPAKRPLPPTSGFAAAAAAAAATSNQQQQQTQRNKSNLAAVPPGASLSPNALTATTVDAAALQARLSQLVGRQLSGLDMARLIPTFPAVPPNADIFSSTPLEALEFSRSELAKMENWEQQQQQQGKAKKAKTAGSETAANATAHANANAPLGADRAREESLLRFLSERLQAAPGSGAAGAGLEGRASGLEGMLPSGAGGGAARAHAAGLPTLSTSPSPVFPLGAGLAGGKRSSRRLRQKS